MDANLMGLWGKELVTYSILVPIVWFLLKQQNKQLDRVTVEIQKGFEQIVTAFEKHEKTDNYHLNGIREAIVQHDYNSQQKFSQLGMQVSQSKLTPEQAKRILEVEMKMVSTSGKLPFLESIMMENHISGRETAIKEKVKAGLMSHSQIYMNYFSDFVCPVGNLADWLNKAFPDKDFDKFASEIGDIVIREDKEPKAEVIRNKLQEITTMMTLLQIGLAERLLKDCKEKEKSSIY